MSEDPAARPEGGTPPVGEGAATATPAATPAAPPAKPAGAPPEGASPEPNKRVCMLCGEREPTFVRELGKSPKGTMLWLRLCEECKPSYIVGEGKDGFGKGEARKPPRKKTKNRMAATDYSETISAILYRLGGCVLEQAGRWLFLYMPENFGTERGAQEAAERTLRKMREQGQVEAISIRRLWLGDAKRHGRRENFFRLSKARAGAAIVEGAIAADEDPKDALAAYRRPWKSGGIDHCSHRADLYLLYAEEALGGGDVSFDPEKMYSETHRDFPYYGAKAALVDNGGERIKLKSTSRRKYEEVTPDGEFVGEFSFPVGDGTRVVECPFLLELERRTNAPKLLDKLQKYCGYWLRRLDAFGEHLVRPVIIVHHDTREARAMGRKPGTGAFALRKTVSDKLFADANGHFGKLDARLTRDYGMPDGFLGRMLLFVEWERIYADDDPFGHHYLPVGGYPTEGVSAQHVSEYGWTVGLTAAALEHARLSIAHAKKQSAKTT